MPKMRRYWKPLRLFLRMKTMMSNQEPLAFFDGSCEKGEGAGGEGSGTEEIPSAMPCRFIGRVWACFLVIGITWGAAQAQTTPPPTTTQDVLKQATPPPKVTTPDVKIPGQLSLPGPSHSELGAQPLTIDEAVSVALKKQPQVNIAWANFVSQQGRVKQVGAGLNPQFSANAAYNNQQSIRNSAAAIAPFTAAISVQQLVF